ncbi:MAG: hypothetical protein EBR82_75065, partial [Caulobacteraceae bacterium]|nr:hypothetical protein [Caulobacteraceae bacterium]
MKPALMAWQTRRMNDRLGLVKNRITTGKIHQFISTNNPNDRIRTFALNLHLGVDKLAKKTNTSIRSTKLFVPWVADSILKNRSMIGKPLTNPELVRYREGVKQQFRPLFTTKSGKFVSDGKQAIHDKVTELLLD